MRRIIALLSLVLLAAIAYPLALAVQVALDLSLGDGESLHWLATTPKRYAVAQVAEDMAAATPIVLGGLVALWIAARFGGRKAVLGLGLAMVAGPLYLPVLPGLILAVLALGFGLRGWGITRCCALALALGLAVPVGGLRAETVVIQIGGGDELRQSQGQIEANVLWLNDLLPKVSDNVTVYFASGAGAEADVSYLDADAAPSPMAGLRRIFADELEDALVERHNILPNLAGSTDKANLTEALKQELRTLRPGDELFLIYNGHGGKVHNDVSKNYLRLWNKTRMTVPELDAILNAAPAESTIRFILPQCFSGTFADLMYERQGSDKLAAQNRCGFLAQSPFEESEGCLLSINKADFRDYTTYYFAPLQGRTRLDEPLPNEPDLNGDGRLNYREGHLYALRNADSTDLARSTSETYLENWQPWWLRFQSWEDNPESLYWGLAEAVAARRGLSLNAGSLREARAHLSGELKNLRATLAKTETGIEILQKSLAAAVLKEWPGADALVRGDGSAGQADNLDAINTALAANDDFRTLVTRQTERQQLRVRQVALARDVAQVDKIFRFKKLARLERQFDRFASDADKAAYQRLLTCESGDLATR